MIRAVAVAIAFALICCAPETVYAEEPVTGSSVQAAAQNDVISDWIFDFLNQFWNDLKQFAISISIPIFVVAGIFWIFSGARDTQLVSFFFASFCIWMLALTAPAIASSGSFIRWMYRISLVVAPASILLCVLIFFLGDEKTAQRAMHWIGGIIGSVICAWLLVFFFRLNS